MTDGTVKNVEACLAVTPGYTDYDKQRWVLEHEKSSYRNDFERDRARVLHSSAWRRLGAKTQVLAPGSDDFVRTRLTHSMEVAQVGRDLGRALGCNPDVVDTACLSHDLGHPPFGHNGEKALNEVAGNIGGFEGNAQTLRILTRLEPKIISAGSGSVRSGYNSAGLNLTRASLDASCKYPWIRADVPAEYARKSSCSKFGVYAEDKPVFDWLRKQENGEEAVGYRRCVEAKVMDLADDISYSVHDVEDAIQGSCVQLGELSKPCIRSRVIEYAQAWYVPDCSTRDIGAALERLEETACWLRRTDSSRAAMAALKNMTSQLIGRFVLGIIEGTRRVYGRRPLTRYTANVVVPEETFLEIAVLKGIAAAFVMTADERQSYYERQRELLHELVASLQHTGDEYLDAMFADDWREACSDSAKLRVIVDQVASLTDNSAMKLYNFLESKGLLRGIPSAA